MNLPKRKSNRLTNYDYSQYGSYFITVCSKEKKPFFCTIQQGTVFDNPTVQLSPIGVLIDRQIQSIEQTYSDIHIDKYVIMPNHIHLILSITVAAVSAVSPANARIPSIISTLKRFTNKSSSCDLWQRSYYDHIIRNDGDYQKIWKYIDDNPAKWSDDCFFVSES